MGNKFREELLDGETVLWEGKSEPFAVLSGAYKQKLPVLWIVCAIYIGLSAFCIPHPDRPDPAHLCLCTGMHRSGEPLCPFFF